MEASEYRRWLELGLGRAVVHARDHGVSGLEDLILEACLHCLALDPRQEGTRVRYMLEVLKNVPDRERYYAAVVESLPGAGDDWDGVQQVVFAAELGARQQIYRWFPSSGKFAGHKAVAVLRMDGLAGLLFVARKLGDRLEDTYLLHMSFKLCGESETWAALRGSPEVAAFQERAKELISRPDHQHKIVDTTYAELSRRMAVVEPHWLTKWGQKAGDQELARAAAGLLAERDPELLERHLRIFWEREFPLEPTPLIQLGEAALRALVWIRDPRVRTLAFRLKNAIELLERNAEPGDHAVALQWFRAEKDPMVAHRMELALKRFPDAAGEVERLLCLYERGPCSVCREFIFERLNKLGAVTAQMREEWAFDSCII